MAEAPRPEAESGPCRIIVMCSGNGTNFQALVDAVSSGRVGQAAIVRMFYNRAKAYARERAERASIPAEYFNVVARGFQPKGERDPATLLEARRAYDAALATEVLRHKPDLIVLAGWMHVFSELFLVPLQDAGVRIINLHPALPGRYDGAGALERAFADFRAGRLENNRTGVMIHYVVAQVDRGDPILTQEVECLEGDTLERLEERTHEVEHELLVRATAKVIEEIAAMRR